MEITTRNITKFILGPWVLLPWTVIATYLFLQKFQTPEMTHDYEKFIFFQGSIDWGKAAIFANTILLYIFFGITAALYLTLKLEELSGESSISMLFLKSIKILKWHIICFVASGLLFMPLDSQSASNDFRNMFLFLCIIYAVNMYFIIFLRKYVKLSNYFKLVIAPIFIMLWVVIGSDGNTPRAGQLVSSDKGYVYQVRGIRHGIMMKWHLICDSIFGDINGKSTNSMKIIVPTKCFCGPANSAARRTSRYA